VKIHVDKIPEDGIELREAVQPEVLSINIEGISFIEPIDVKANVTKSGEEIFVDISLEAPVEYTCAKCLSKFNNIFRKEFNMIMDVKPGEVVELNEELRQEIILDYPMKIICQAGCLGLCSNCGQNLNTGKCDCT
jgi:uncharacterized protein